MSTITCSECCSSWLGASRILSNICIPYKKIQQAVWFPLQLLRSYYIHIFMNVRVQESIYVGLPCMHVLGIALFGVSLHDFTVSLLHLPQHSTVLRHPGLAHKAYPVDASRQILSFGSYP